MKKVCASLFFWMFWTNDSHRKPDKRQKHEVSEEQTCVPCSITMDLPFSKTAGEDHKPTLGGTERPLRVQLRRAARRKIKNGGGTSDFVSRTEPTSFTPSATMSSTVGGNAPVALPFGEVVLGYPLTLPFSQCQRASSSGAQRGVLFVSLFYSRRAS